MRFEQLQSTLLGTVGLGKVPRSNHVGFSLSNLWSFREIYTHSDLDCLGRISLRHGILGDHLLYDVDNRFTNSGQDTSHKLYY